MKKHLRISNLTNPDQIINCACVLHGNYYGFEYVEKLERALRHNFSVPINFHIWTEKERQVPKHMIRHDLVDLGVNGPKKAWWYKIQLFNSNDFNGQLFYFDLDLIILGNLNWMLRLSNDHFWAVRDFRYLWKRDKNSINSSVMVFNTGNYSGLWKKFKSNLAAIISQYHGDQDYINVEIPIEKQRFLDTDHIKSYRWQIKDGGMNFVTRSYPNKGKDRRGLFENTSIIVFHGTPKPHEISNDADVTKHWK